MEGLCPYGHEPTGSIVPVSSGHIDQFPLFYIIWMQNWTLTLREEKRLQVFGNKFLRKIFGPKRDDQTGEWIRLHNGELHDLYGKPDIIRTVKSRRLRWAGHVTRMGNGRRA